MVSRNVDECFYEVKKIGYQLTSNVVSKPNFGSAQFWLKLLGFARLSMPFKKLQPLSCMAQFVSIFVVSVVNFDQKNSNLFFLDNSTDVVHMYSF